MMKKLFALCLCLSCLTAWAQFSGQGSGTEKDPYQITNADELFEIRNDLNAFYKLMNDVDVTEWIQEDNPKQGWNPIGNQSTPFLGMFDGNFHVIKNLYINRPNVSDIGLFGCVSNNAILKNICLVNPQIIGNSNVGGIVGVVVINQRAHSQFSILNNQIIGGFISGENSVGGLIGFVDVDEGSCETVSSEVIYFSEIKGNMVYADVKATSYAAGICGSIISGQYAYYYSNYTHGRGDYFRVKIEDNKFEGNLNSNGVSGGILALSKGKNWYSSFSYYINPNFELNRNISKGTIKGETIANGIMGEYYPQSSYGQSYASLTYNVAAIDSLIGGTSINKIYSSPYPNNFSYSNTYTQINNKIIELEDDDCNGSSFGMKTLKRQTTYEGMGYDFSQQWSIIESETLPYNINQTPPPHILSFVSGSKGCIQGISPNPVGKAYLFIGANVFETYIQDGKWMFELGYVKDSQRALIAIKSEDKMPSILIGAISESAPVIEPEYNAGDANGDGSVDVSDVVGIINHLVGKTSESFNEKNADVNKDGQVLVDDAVGTVEIILNSQN